MKRLAVVIPALKKNGVIPDQLIKKLNGVTLIQRAIDVAKELKEDIFIVTDSMEISLIAERNGVEYIYNSKFKIYGENILQNFREFLKDIDYSTIFIYRANTPLLELSDLREALQTFEKNRDKVLVSVKEEKFFKFERDSIGDYFRKEESSYREINSFIILSSKSLQNRNIEYLPYLIPDEKAVEIESYQDWWISEKLLQRKRIVIHVFGSTSLGMGHIYRSLALAHEITNHEVIFVCNSKYELAVKKIASMDYQVIPTDEVLKTIQNLKPDLVINDVLNTEAEFIKSLNSKVVNFEDMGSGGREADLTINELFEEAVLDGENYLWGHQYYFLRDEFEDAKPHQFLEKVSSLLISFGGGDRNNITLKSFNAVVDIAKELNIKIHIVCGGGYLFRTELEKAISDSEYENIDLTFESGVISKIMEQSQIAISSNGRTVYELADMNIPSIVISQHERESTHSFSTLSRGFINLGVVRDGIEVEIRENFRKIVLDSSYRELLFLNIKRYSFRENKSRVVNKILGLL